MVSRVPDAVHRFCNVNGYPLAYVEAGTRTPALLLVHGSINDYRSFEQQVTPLSTHAKTIAVSLRHSYPERWDGVGDGFSVEQHAEDLAAFIEAQAQGPMHVLGHSRGGAVVLQLALTHPEAVRTLILADPGGLEALLPPSPEGEAMARQSSEMFARLRDNLAKGDEAAALERFVEDLSGPGAWARRTPAQRQVMLDNIRTGPACAQRPSFTPAQIASLAMPILPVTGSGSPSRYRLMLDAMRKLNSGVAPLATIEGAAHAMHRENATAFNSAVRDFIAVH
jgi:pimeloyl-ACP methyl ester carboxylesterase